MSKILVTAATGQLGGLIIQELLKLTDAGNVVGLARTPEKAKGLGIEIRQGDYNSPDLLEAACSGIDTVMLISGTDIGPRVQQHKNVVDAAKAAGVKRIAYTSVVIAQKRPEPIYHDHGETEDYIKASGMNYTFLRNNFYMNAYVEEIKIAIEKGVYRGAIGETGAALVARADLARAAAAALADEQHANKTYHLSGPAVVDGSEYARIASAISGKEISYQPISIDELKADYLARGYDANMMPFLLLLEETIASGDLVEVSPDIENLTGQKPQSFEEHARAVL